MGHYDKPNFYLLRTLYESSQMVQEKQIQQRMEGSSKKEGRVGIVDN